MYGALAGLIVLLTSCSQTPFLTSSGAWVDRDIGNVGIQGSAVDQNGGATLVVHGSGNDIWGNSDSFNFYYVPVTGDATVTTHVTDVQYVDQWTKAGVMIRESAAPDARNVFVLLSPSNGTDMTARGTSGGATGEAGNSAGPRPPYWLRLVRTGDTFTGYQSSDGGSWTALGSVTIPMTAGLMAGLAVTSKDNGTLAEAVFDNTTVTSAGGTVEPGPSPSPSPSPSPGGDVQTVSYQADGSVFGNPERGWYVEPAPSDYAGAAAAGYTLAMRFVRLDSYTNQALPSSFLSGLRSDFQAARGSGVKLVLRFAYNRSTGSDAPLNIVLQHISQLGPVLTDYADVIAAMQAGFIGQWGEWHDSTNGLTSLSARTQIVNALLAALPRTRMIQIRYPYMTRDIFPNPVTAGNAFGGSNVARVGQHNDCFVSTSADGGTFITNADRTYAAAQTLYTPMGGETCDLGGLTTRNDCPTALQEMATYHWDYLNHDFYGPVISKWQSQGCYAEITKRLGYRFTLQQMSATSTVAAGGTFSGTLTMQNSGFGKLYNPRPMQLVLAPVAGGANVVVTLAADARRLLPEPGSTRAVAVSATVPAGTPAGTYSAYLALPDSSPNLQGDPRYSIRLADANMWNAATGLNDLSFPVTVR